MCVHNSNAGVRIEPDLTVAFQKRTSDVTVGHDNAGFAAWGAKYDWSKIHRIYGKENTYIIWGEWAGPGVANGDAVALIPNKTFFIFSIEIIYPDGNIEIRAEPDAIEEMIGGIGFEETDVTILPWAGEAKLVRFFGDLEGSITPQEYADYINSKVERMEVRDDYIFEKYGVEKSGEGFVCYPVLDEPEFTIPRSVFGSMVFKAKTSAHSANKTKGVKVKVDVPANVIDFADTFVTEARCEQMIREHCDGEYSMKRTPDFLRALVADIEKESVNEREASGLEMKDAQKVISNKAVHWLKSKTELV